MNTNLLAHTPVPGAMLVTEPTVKDMMYIAFMLRKGAIMTSAKEVEANRRNALKSSGPKTPEEKAPSA